MLFINHPIDAITLMLFIEVVHQSSNRRNHWKCYSLMLFINHLIDTITYNEKQECLVLQFQTIYKSMHSFNAIKT